ncbi:hypothetical protein QFC22_000209 [Naganishia vaughanmartiniae]|uniref:Uncharacterized protein n=1 Tax=Naganishia vaughanmartiniae TaxID=1424756 RepID=A0ACC2XP78_9TREE|nr:hypothetical protein QFC22_000209 [Naganishia vaughanmartiniae]
MLARNDSTSDLNLPAFEDELSRSPERTHIANSLDQKLVSRRNASADRSSQSVAFQPKIPESLARGVPMIKISNRKIKQRTFRLQPPTVFNPVLGELVGDRRGIEGYATIRWESRKIGRISVDQIREIRYGSAARPSAAATNALPSSVLTPAATSRWISIVYNMPPTSWKTLNMIALSDEILEIWVRTLYTMVQDIKQVSFFRLDKPRTDSDATIDAAAPTPLPLGLTSDIPLGNSGIIGIMGIKDYEPDCDGQLIGLDSLHDRSPSLVPARRQSFPDLEGNDRMEQKVTLPEVIALCRKIGFSQKVGQTPSSLSSYNIASGIDDGTESIGLIEVYFRSLDHDNRGYLDFEQFRALVQMIKINPDIRSLWNGLCNDAESDDPRKKGIGMETFKAWMREEQGVRFIFEKGREMKS